MRSAFAQVTRLAKTIRPPWVWPQDFGKAALEAGPAAKRSVGARIATSTARFMPSIYVSPCENSAVLPRSLRTPLLIGALLLALLLGGCGGGGGGDSTAAGGYKESLFQRLEDELKEEGAPQDLTHCLISKVDAAVGKDEVEAAYGKVPVDATAQEMAEAIGPQAVKAFARSSAICVHTLMAEGKLSAKEVAEALRPPSG